MQDEPFRITGETRVDYFHVLCADCGGHVEVDYKGYVGGVPEIVVRCDSCDQETNFKLMAGRWGGLPLDPAP